MDSTETAVAVASACAAVLALVLALLAARTVRGRSDRRFDAVIAKLDEHLGRISASLERVVERAESVRARGVDDLELTVDFDEVLRKIAAEAALRTGAEAAAAHVRGPAGEPRSAEFGAISGETSLDAPLARATGPFRAVTINWSYLPGAADASDPVTSALVVPIVERGRETGTLAAYAPTAGAFGPEHVQALESLAAAAGPALTAARRLADAQRELTDASTGLRNSSGYDLELERAVSRARETGRPLSLLILSRDELSGSPGTAGATDADVGLRELAALLVRATRTTDVVCRRRTEQFGIVLPDTAGDPARQLYGRLLDAAGRTSFRTTGQLTFASGLVEWRPDETSAALDARALAAVGQTRIEPLRVASVPAEPVHSPRASLRIELEDRLAREADRARHLERPLTLLVARVDGIRRIEAAHGTTAAERVLDEVEARLRDVLGHGDTCLRVETDTLAATFPGSGSSHAEHALAALQTSLASDPATHLDRLSLSAGVTELASGDDAAGVLERAEHALERASQAGPGTVVVALATEDAE